MSFSDWARRKFQRMRHHHQGGTGLVRPLPSGRTPSSSPTGLYVMATAGHREPLMNREVQARFYEAPGGETPPGDST